MQLDELLYHLHHPDSLDQFDDEALKQLMIQYPYLESLKSAYFKKSRLHSNQHQDLYEKLSDLVNDQYSNNMDESNLAPAVFDLKLELPSSKVESTEYKPEPIERIVSYPIEIPAHIYTPWYDYQRSSFIQFLDQLPTCKVPSDMELNIVQSKKPELPKDIITPDLHRTNELISSSLDLRNDIASESLANLWTAQGRPELAIQMFEKLIVENPEKSIIFAAKIEKLKTDYSL